MPIVENHSEHPFHFPKPIKATGSGPMDASTSAFEEAVTFPRAGAPDDDGNPVPSRTLVSAEILAAIQAHPVAKGWFHRRGLSVASDDAKALDPKNEDAMGAPVKGKPKT